MWVFPSRGAASPNEEQENLICVGKVLQCQHRTLTSASQNAALVSWSWLSCHAATGWGL